MAAPHAPSGRVPAGRTPSGISRTTASSGFRLPTQAGKFTSSGTFIASATGWYRVLAVGGGGAGSAGFNTGHAYNSGAGAGSGFVAFGLVFLQAGEEVAVAVGAGGTGSTGMYDVNFGANTSFGSHVIAAGGQGGLQHSFAGAISRGGTGFSGGGQLTTGSTSGGWGGVNGAHGGTSDPGFPAGGGQGTGAFDATFNQFVSWTISGAARPATINSYEYQGGNGVKVEEDDVSAGIGYLGSVPDGGCRGGNGYGAGGGGGLYNSNPGKGGSGADGICLVEGPIL